MLSMPRIVRPDPNIAEARLKFGSPAGTATRRSIKQNKELAEYCVPVLHWSRAIQFPNAIAPNIRVEKKIKEIREQAASRQASSRNRSKRNRTIATAVYGSPSR